MMKWMRERLDKDGGFTLIELMVVVLIIAILIAIAIPSFLGFRRNAQDRSAQSDVRNVLLAEQAYYTEWEAYTTTEADLQTIEPSIRLETAIADGVVASTGTDSVCLTRESKSGNAFSVFMGETSGIMYGKTDLSTCPNDTAAPATHAPDGWQ
ncbi:MAG: prepilin-type N-terminal cleavage/methylation domain-containing protein [Acidimicrobiia bacterium]